MITLATVLGWILQVAVAFASTIAFAVIFHTPRKELLYTGLTGASGWLVYMLAHFFGSGVVASSFLAALALTWLSRVFSFMRKAPVTVFLICGIFPLVPGAGIYYTGYAFFMGNDALALEKGLETIKIAVAIALGIGIVLSLPPFLFHRSGRPKNREKG